MGFRSCKGHRLGLLTNSTLLIQSLPIQYTALDSCGGLDRLGVVDQYSSVQVQREVTTELDLSKKVLFYYRDPLNHD